MIVILKKCRDEESCENLRQIARDWEEELEEFANRVAE